MTRPGDLDFHLFHEGKHTRIHEFLGAHPARENGVDGTRFTVWAPNAEDVWVVGDFEGWGENPVRLEMLRSVGAAGSGSGVDSGLWSGFAPRVSSGARYKYRIRSRYGGYRVDKADPIAFRAEESPGTASIVWPLDFEWRDDGWMRERGQRNALTAPVSIYEVHLGSWMRVPGEGNRWLSYAEVAPRLTEHVHRCGFTHVELLPIMEHPFYGSWGYQVTGYFAASARYGSPQDFMALIDHLHREGIGVILDWTPAHFPTDEHGLIYFDGTHLYEHADPRQGRHPDWGTAIFNYGRNEVRSFLLSNAAFWLERYHVDGLRVDAVASMLYLDYSRKAGEWIPNVHGGRENLEAIEFLRIFNEATYREHPDVLLIAEESTSWPMVSRPTYAGGLGFGAKWDMGWMHDTLAYFAQDPIHRRYFHHRLTFRGLYMASENFVLPLSHDEVVHGKGSLLGKMPGDDWQRFASLRLLLADMWAQPGKKLLFMGGEIAQWREWNHDASLDWHLVADPASPHAGVMRLVAELNRLYREEPALHQGDVGEAGFEWIDANDAEASVYAFLRKGQEPDDVILFVMSCTPVPRHGYRVGVPCGGVWRELLNTDAVELGGSGVGNFGAAFASAHPCHGRPASLVLTLPPLGALFLKAPSRSVEGPLTSGVGLRGS